MFVVRKTDFYERWFRELRDVRAQARINVRIRRIEDVGSFGDCKPVGGGVSELRIDYGPGYRVYFTKHGSTVVLLLSGGTKKSQQADIAFARSLV